MTYESLQYKPLLIPAHQQTGWLLQIVGLQNIMQEAIGKTSLYTIVKKTKFLHSPGVVWVKQTFMEIPPDKKKVNIFNICHFTDTGYGSYFHYCHYANS